MTKTTEVDWSFCDFDGECGLGEIDIDITLICDCDHDGHGTAELKEVMFRRITDKFGSLIYPGEVAAGVWSVLHDYVVERSRDRWVVIEPIALAADPVQFSKAGG
jgi:hypothetical protein